MLVSALKKMSFLYQIPCKFIIWTPGGA